MTGVFGHKGYEPVATSLENHDGVWHDPFPEDAQVNKGRSMFSLRGLFVHVCLIAAYTVIFVVALRYQQDELDRSSPNLIYTPARSAVKWVRKEDYNPLHVETPYSGPPSPALDEAWGRLVQNSNLKVSADELRKLNASSIQLQDGSGMYFSGLQVHHHLHCLKLARQMIYHEYYQMANDSGAWIHLDHCLEDIRLALMCKADYSLITYDWLTNFTRPWANWRIENECVDWDALEEWAGKRAFSAFDEVSLVHPVHGLSFPVRKDSEIGSRPPHASLEDIQALAEGRHPKGNWGP